MAQTPPVLEKEKVAPDEGALVAGSFESLAGQKVQLDIDDAPFMMPDEPPADLPATSNSGLDTSEEKPAAKKISRKMVIGLAALLLALAAAAGVYYFLSLPPPPPEPEPTIIIVPSDQSAAATLPTEFNTTLAPFWVEITDSNGVSRFLVCTFTVTTDDSALNKEIADKMVTLRDAIYYYLRGKDYVFLTTPGNASLLKDDLLAAINNYLVQGDLQNLYFDSFLVR